MALHSHKKIKVVLLVKEVTFTCEAINSELLLGPHMELLTDNNLYQD